MLAFAVSAIVALSVLLWFLVQKLVGKPVRELVKATNIVASGKLDYRIEETNNGEFGHLANSFNEMTRKLGEAQRQIYQSDKLASLGRLAASVAHEINNPLTGVLTYSSFLLKRLENGEMKQDLEVIVRETKRCRDIVKGLLDFARQTPSNKAYTRINDVIIQTLGILKNQLNIKHISVKKELGTQLQEIRIDANQIQQALMNLLVNAIDAIGKKGGEITIKTEQTEIDGTQYIKIDIADSGCGIPNESLTKIFEPFYSTKGQKGTGLGLAMVWGVVEKHNGQISVASEVGKGTTFTLHLPVDANSASLIEGKAHESAI